MANSLANLLVNQYIADLEKFQNNNLTLTEADKTKIKVALYALNVLDNLTSEFHQSDLEKTIKLKIEKYQNSVNL